MDDYLAGRFRDEIDKVFSSRRQPRLPFLLKTGLAYEVFHRTENGLASSEFNDGQVWMFELPSNIHGAAAAAVTEELANSVRLAVGPGTYLPTTYLPTYILLLLPTFLFHLRSFVK